MKTVTANEALALDITETPLNVEFKEVQIDGEYSATVGVDRAIPSFEQLLAPFVDLSNALQVEFDPTIKLLRSSYGTDGTIYTISMGYKDISLGGRETKSRIIRHGSFNSSCSDRFGLAMWVQVCSNGMMGWKSANNAVTRFTSNWDTISSERVQSALGSFDAMQEHYIDMANDLKSIRLTAPQVDDRLSRIVKGVKTFAICSSLGVAIVARTLGTCLTQSPNTRITIACIVTPMSHPLRIVPRAS